MNDDLLKAYDTLRAGGIILYPTDTIWGIGCDATCEDAVQRIYSLKQRQDERSMLILLADGSVGIRIVKDEFCRLLIRKLGKPLVSTSANVSGKPWPPRYNKIDKSLVKAADYVVNWRQNDEKRGKPSGIIKLGRKGEIQ